MRFVRSQVDPAMVRVRHLSDQNKRWLGLIPYGAMGDYADRGRILVAESARAVVGYALFDLPSNRVRLAQLCVDADARDRHVARRLIEHLSGEFSDRTGIAVRCRRDWPANDVWPRLGFEPRSNTAGRSAAGHLVTSWWRDHGHPDLFAAALLERDPTVLAIDTNVFRDIHETGRSDRSESMALRSEWLGDGIELVVTTGVKAELNRHPEPQVRERLLSALINYRTLRTDYATACEMRDAVLAEMPPEARARDSSLLNDSLLAAEARIGAADAFVSRDQVAVELLRQSVQLAPMWVATPSDLIVHLDELRDATNYAPTQLLDTGYSVAAPDSSSEPDLYRLISHSEAETKTRFRMHCRATASLVGKTASRRVIRDPLGAVQGAIFTVVRDARLDVTLLRAVDPRIAPTMARQLIYLIRREARDNKLQSIAVTDPALTAVVRAALHEAGFHRQDDGTLTCLVIDGCLSWEEVVQRSEIGPAHSDSPSGPPSGVIAAELERVSWPLKIRDADLPCFMIPIRPGPAQELFGLTPMLFARNSELGLSRKHVYYRSPVPRAIEAPGRVLWYASGDRRTVVASSRIDSVDVAHPSTLHRRYRRFGVLDRSVIEGRAKGGRAQAIVFSDTELFAEPVPLARLRDIDQNGHLEPLPSPRRISPENFFTVYQEGRPQ